MSKDISTIANYIIYFCFAALFFVTPLILTPINSELFEFNKMMFVYGITVVIVGAWIIKATLSMEWKTSLFNRTPLDIPIFFFLVSQVLATIFSIDPHMSIWGYYSRQNGGLLSTVAYIVLFYAFVSNFSFRNGDGKCEMGSGKKSRILRKSKNQNISHQSAESANHTSHFTLHTSIARFLHLALGAGLVVAIYGIAQHFGIDKHLWVQDVQNRVFSTLGQPNWLAAYMGILAMVALGLAIGEIGNREDKRDKSKAIYSVKSLALVKRLALVGLVAVYYLTILYTKSRSGLFAFWVGNGAFWSLVAIRQIGRIGQIRRIFIGLNFALFILTFVVGVPVEKINKFMLPGWLQKIGESKIERIVIDRGNQGTVIARGGTESGKIRQYVWQASIEAAKANPVFGTGVETFAWAFYKYKPVEHNLTSEWDFLYNKAHNEYLNYAATTGFVGLGSYLLVIGVFGIWAMREMRRNKGNLGGQEREKLLVAGLFAGWVSILMTNFFGFSVVVTSLYFWLIPAFVFVLTRQGHLVSFFRDVHKGFIASLANTTSVHLGKIWVKSGKRYSHVLALIVALVAGYLLVVIGKYWYADVLYARGKRYLRDGYTLQSNRVLRQAVKLRPGEPIFWDELGYLEGTLAIEAFGRREATRSAELVADALDHQGKALRISPENLNFLKTRVKLYYMLSEIFDDNSTSGDSTPSTNFLKLAIGTLELGRELAPNDPKILYNLALLEASSTSGVGRAIETLKEALALKPDYRDGRIALGLFYKEEGELGKAKKQFEYILQKINPEDERAAQYLEDIEKF